MPFRVSEVSQRIVEDAPPQDDLDPENAPSEEDQDELEESDASEGEVEADTGAVAPVVWNNHLPAAQGNVPAEFHKETMDEQRENTNSFFTFITLPNINPAALNEADNPLVTFLIQIPKSAKVRVAYLPGFGSGGFGNATRDLDGKILALTQDGGKDLGTPHPVILPRDVLERHDVPAVSMEQFHQKITAAGGEFDYPLLQRRSINTIVGILKIAPIPAYMVYDGFHRDLNAADVLERVLSMEGHDTAAVLLHLKKFLRAVLSGQNANDAKPYISHEEMMAPISGAARRWANNKFSTRFPALATQMVEAGVNQQLPHQLALILAQMQSQQARVPTPGTPETAGEEKKEEDPNYGLSRTEIVRLLQMCGYQSTDSPERLPEWIKKFSEKNISKATKTNIIHDVLHPNKHYFDDAELQVTGSIIKMVVERAWLGNEGNYQRPNYFTAMEGISPFALKAYTDDEVAQLNQEDEMLNSATHRTVEDMRAQKKTLKPTVPTSPYDFLKLLRRLGNFFHVVFGDLCPLFLSMEMVIEAYQKCSEVARKNMSDQSRAAMLWIILLQCREFAQGRMDILAEFEEMVNMIKRKNLHITHDECPINHLLGKKRPAHTTPPVPLGGYVPSPTRPKVELPWHPKLKQVLDEPVKMHTNAAGDKPSFMRILRFCGHDAIPGINGRTRECVPYMTLNYCRHGHSCNKNHGTATDAQATLVMTALKRFIEKPRDFRPQG